MASTSPISARNPGRRAGFTLVEVMIASALALMIFAAVFSAYLFLGRNLTRLVNFQRQEVESRRALRLFSEDVSAATQITTAAAAQLALVRPTNSGNTTVTYTYSAADGTLTRVAGAASQTIVTGLTSLSVSYFNSSGSSPGSNLHAIKAVELAFATRAGSSAGGTLAQYTTASPRILMRNKAVLE